MKSGTGMIEARVDLMRAVREARTAFARFYLVSLLCVIL
jgi:hypothetical protein